jgi:hypothetical protein
MTHLHPRFAALKLSARLFVICVAFGLTASMLGATAYVQGWKQDDAQQTPPAPATRIEKLGAHASESKEETAEAASVAPDEILPSVASNYADFTATNGSLTNMTTGTTQLVAAEQDDTASTVTNIGFDFYFQGVRHTQFSVNSNGLLRLGAAAVQGSTPYKPLAQAGLSLLTAYGADQATHTTGKVHFKVTGSAPNRMLVVEWLNMQSNFHPGGAADLTYQIRLFETTGVIQYVYGKATMSALGAADVNSRDPHIGFSSGNTAGTVGSVTAPQSGSPAPTFNGASATPAANLYTAGVIPVLDSASDGSRRLFTFTPPTPVAPTNLTFNAVAPTTMTLNWTDSANEAFYAIYRSTDGTNYSFINTAAQNATSFNATGLTPATNYFWQIYAVSEGALSPALAGSQATVAAGNITSTAVGGNWSSTLTWTGGVVPTANDHVTIADGAAVTIDTAANALSLNVGTGLVAPATLQFEATTARTLNATTNVNIAANGTFRSATTGTQVGHVLSLGGDLTNGGVLDFSTNTNTAGAGITFTGATNNTFGGAGATTDVRAITINKGASNVNILELNSSVFTVRGAVTDSTSAAYLTLTNGTFKISGTFAVSFRTFTPAAYTIGATTGFWLNNDNYVVTAQNASPTNAGLLRLTRGVFNVGTASGNSMGGSAGAVFIIEGGSFQVSGRFSPAGAVSYTQTGGAMVVCNVGQISNTAACFDLPATSSFTMSGGIILLQQASTASISPLDYQVLSSTINITGGTLNVGSPNTTTNFNFRIRGNAPGIFIDGNTNPKTATLVNNLSVFANTTIAPGSTLNLNGFTYAQAGTFLFNNGTILGNTAGSRLYFAGAGGQQYGGSGVAGTNALPLQSVDFDSAAVTIQSGVSNNLIMNRVSMFRGNVTNANKLTLGTGGTSTGVVQFGVAGATSPAGSFDVAPTFNLGSGGEVVIYAQETAARTTGVEINPTRVLSGLNVNNTNHLIIAGGDLAVTGALALTNGTVTTGSSTLISTSSGTVTRSNGYVIGNFKQTFTANGSKTFAVGTADGFSPVVANVTAGTGDLTVRATQGKLPSISGANVLARYWTLNGVGLTADLQFFYLPGDVTGTESSYAIVKRDGAGVLTFPGGSVDPSTHIASIGGVTSFSDWTLAEPAAVQSGAIQFDSATYSVGESGGTVTLNATRTGGTDGAVGIAYTTADGTASSVAGADYLQTTGVTSWAAGESGSKPINITISPDALDEPDETFTVSLSNPSGGATLGSPSTATVTINDDDNPATPASVVYVDDDWVGLANGTDPDGAGGAATSIGYDAFATIQGGVNGVAPNGTVNVAPGTYDEDVNVNKTLSLLGAGAATTNIRGVIGGSGTTVFVTASNSTVAGFTITRLGNNTTDWNNPGLNSAGVAMQGQATTGVLIRDNVITGNRTGLDINNSSGHTVRNNVIDFNRTGLIFRNQTDSMTVVENFITNNWTVGILFLDASGGTNSPVQSAAHSTFSNNNISANWYGQIVDRQSGGSLPAPATTNYKNFIGNWYGTTSPVVTTANSAEPGYAAQIPVAYGGTAAPPGGQPDIAGSASANFKYTPFLKSGTDTNVETTPGRGTNGFQGVPNTIVVSPPNQNGWFFFDDNPGVGVGTGGFEEGPATPPLGAGSAFLQVDDTARHALGTFGYGGTRFDDLTELQYSSYQTTNTNTVYAPSLQFDIDYDLNDTTTSFQGRLVFEPYQSGTVQQNVWQNWDTLAGKWYGTRTTVPVGNVNVPNPCQQATPCTRQQVLASFPNSGIRNTPTSFLLFKAGGPWPPNFRGNVDALKLGIGSAHVTYDFEPTPQLSIDDVTHAEGNVGTTSYTFTVTLSRASDQTVTVDYATADDTATVADNDYTAIPTTQLSFAPGETTKQFTVTVIGDNKLEPNEQFFVNLSNASAGAGIFDAQGIGMITNDDGVPAISINDVTVAEPDTAGTSNATFTVSLSNASSAPVTVDYQTADDTATAPDDYNAVTTTTLTFDPGQTSKPVTVTVNGDALAEGTETFSVNLSNPTGATIADSTGTGTITDPTVGGQVLIGEFRFRGATFDAGAGVDGSRDEFVELYNNTDEPITVGASDGSQGWAVATVASDGTTVVTLATIPAGTSIAARGHYLVAYSDTPVNPATGGYSLAGQAEPDLLYLDADIADNAGVALFRTAEAANFTAANRLDAAGFNSLAGATADMFREGAGLISPGANDGEYAFVRKLTTGFPQDTGDNAADFAFVSTDGGLYGGVQSILGAPGPENSGNPVQRNGVIKASLIDGSAASTAPPNRVRSGQIQPGVPNAYGTLSIQRRFKNTTALPVTRLRFRVVDITTLNSPAAGSPQADLRVLSSTGVVTNSQGDEVITVTGLTLETPPAQTNGGGLNSTLTVVLPGGALAPGNSIDVQFLLGVQEQGNFRFLVNVEALPGPTGSALPEPEQSNMKRRSMKTTARPKAQ